MTLRELKIGQSALITNVGGEGALRQHFLDMGVIPGIVVKLVKFAPMGDPMQLLIHGYLLTLRLDDAAQIAVSLDVPAEKERPEIHSRMPHPGLGEDGIRYHDPNHRQAVPKGQKLTFALIGNQNCGKTTLFNALTGSSQHVGNFPGVTVDRKSGVIKGYSDTEVTDLPGIYSLSPYTAEEIVSRQFLQEEHPTAIINIVDATNIERNMYLTMQLMALGVPMVLALNMMDEVIGNGGTILINEMELALGLPVVPISASKGEGIYELVNHAIHVAKYQEAPMRQDFCDNEDHGGAVHRCLHAIMHLVEDHCQRAEIPVRFAASKIVEGDQMVIDSLKLAQNELETIEHIIVQMEEERGLDRAAAIADMRFSFIKRLCDNFVVKPKVSKEQRRSELIDKVLTGKWTALPSFVCIMALVFWLTFNVVGAWLQDILDGMVVASVAWIDATLTALDVHSMIHSLVVDGVCAGIGSVLSFLPVILILFFFLSMLEDSGYMARIAFVMDKLLRRIGLSGRSIVPMLIGFGCSVPAVMSTRTLPSARDRRLTIMLTPFMSCTAKLPIYAFFCAAFFPGQGAIVMTGLYLLGILTGVVFALVLKGSVFKGEAVPFVMELPTYRMPGLKNVLMLLWDKARDFLSRAFTVIFLASIAIWVLQSYSFSLSHVEDPSESMLAVVSSLLSPLFTPLGFGDWRMVTALVSGFMAKESVVSTLGVLFAQPGSLEGLLTQGSALVLLVFCLLYTPCVAAVAAIRRELGGNWAFGIVIGQCVIAWIVAFLVHIIIL